MKRIAIQVVNAEQNHAYDRRRFLPFAAQLKRESVMDYDTYLDIRTLDIDNYDVIIISIRSNLPFILKLLTNKDGKRLPKIIFDYCDFIHMTDGVRFYIKSLLAVNRKNYSESFTKKDFFKLLSQCDSVIVGSEAQKRLIEQYHANISVISDILQEIPVQPVTEDRNGILWEGFAGSNYGIFKRLFRLLHKTGLSWKLNIVTDQQYYFVAGKFFRVNTKTLFRFFNFLYPVHRFETVEWNVQNLLKLAADSAAALIPISDNRIARMKPENKIVLLIRLGIYPIVSDIPSYVDFANRYGLNICFSSDSDAKNILNNFSVEKQRLASKRDQILADYSWASIMEKWRMSLHVI